jgi:hypothetical protein
MPVERQPISFRTFCDEMAIDQQRFIGVEVNRQTSTVYLVLEPEDESNERRDPATESGREADSRQSA